MSNNIQTVIFQEKKSMRLFKILLDNSKLITINFCEFKSFKSSNKLQEILCRKFSLCSIVQYNKIFFFDNRKLNENCPETRAIIIALLPRRFAISYCISSMQRRHLGIAPP